MSRLRGLGKDCEGTAAIEMALVAPLFLLIIFGMIVYGSWFSLALSVQSLATESARASIGGLDSAERQTLALAYIDAHTSPSGLNRDDIEPVIDASTSVTTVSIRLDITGHPVMALCQFIPSPPQFIERSAVILSGGT